MSSPFFHLAQEHDHLRALLVGTSHKVRKAEAEMCSARQNLVRAKVRENRIRHRLSTVVRELRQISPNHPCFCAGCFAHRPEGDRVKRNIISEETQAHDLSLHREGGTDKCNIITEETQPLDLSTHSRKATSHGYVDIASLG